MATNINITTTPTLLVSAKVARLRGWFLLEVAAGATKVYVSQNPAVTPATGFALEPTPTNASTLFGSGKPASGAWYGITASGSALVKVEEGAGDAVGRGTDSMIAIYRPAMNAYDLAVQEGFAGTLAQWLESLGTGASDISLRLSDDETSILIKKHGQSSDLAQIDLNEIPAP